MIDVAALAEPNVRRILEALEAGTRRHGYTERAPFGPHQRDPLSTHLEKRVG